MKYVAYVLGGLFILSTGLAFMQAGRYEKSVEELNTLLTEAVEKARILEQRLKAAEAVKESAPPPEVPVPVIQTTLIADMGATNELTVTTVDQSGGEGPQPMNEATINAIQRFDYAMDREFNRLEEREQKSADEAEVATIQVIKGKLGDLDALYIRADQAETDEERIEIRQEMEKTMGSIIGLSRQDRNERLAKLATDIGYEDPQAVQQFVREIDRVYRETHIDWTKLFNRTPPAMGAAGGRSVSPGMTGTEQQELQPAGSL